MRVADVMTEAGLLESPTDTWRDAAALRWREQTGFLVVGVFAALQSQTGDMAIDSDELVRTRRIVRIEHGDLD